MSLHVCLVVGKKGLAGAWKFGKGVCFSLVIIAGDMIHELTCMSCGWKEGLGWGVEVSEKGSVKQTTLAYVIDIIMDLCPLWHSIVDDSTQSPNV